MNTCIDVFKNINIVNQQNQLSISPCCISTTKPINSIDFFNNKYLTTVRTAWKSGQFPTACVNCKNAEDQEMPSRRQGANTWYQDNNLNNDTVEMIRMDYWTGDLCNLACVICGPDNSSVWKQELNLPQVDKKTVINQFWKELDLSTLKYVHFNGGEPLLSKTHVEILQALPNKNQVHITYNTNATIIPDQVLLDLWQQFKLVQLDFSIDDIDQRFEYQRYPAKWANVKNNLQWYIDNAPHNCMFAVNTSVGILNHANLHNLNAWLQQNFYVSRFTDPIEHRQQSTIGLFSLNNYAQKQGDIKEFLESCDTRRGTNWRATFPELVEYLD
jgi:sulfatase maturation enzyme AslB (radical SAM superfamily)